MGNLWLFVEYYYLIDTPKTIRTQPPNLRQGYYT